MIVRFCNLLNYLKCVFCCILDVDLDRGLLNSFRYIQGFC